MQAKRFFSRFKGAKPGPGGYNCPCCSIGNSRARKRKYHKIARRELERAVERAEAGNE